MFKRILLALPLLFIAVGFQNCAPAMQSADLESNLAPLKVETEHEDRDHDTREFEEKIIEVRARDLIADRILLNKQLVSIFGATATTLDKDGVLADLRSFGSPCSAYEQYNFYDAGNKNALTVADRTRLCPVSNSASGMRASLYPEVSTTRQGVMEHYCRALSNNATSRSVVLKKIESSGKPASSKQNLLKAFRIFYRSAPTPPDSLLESLQVMLPGESTVAADWEPVIFTLCISPGWQIL